MTAEEIRGSLLRAGFEPDEIPALLGNIDVETGSTFDFRQLEKTSRENKGYGLFQFTGGHLSSYMQYLEDTDQEDSADAQARFVYENIYSDNPPHVIGAGNQRKIRQAFDSGSLSDKSNMFGRWYERFQGSEDFEHPSYNERIERSKKY